MAELKDICRADPKKILPLLAKQDLGNDAPEEVEPSGEKAFHASYTKLQRLPKEFLRSYLPGLSDGKLTDTHLRNLERNEEGTTRAISYFSCNVIGGTKWPTFCLDRDIFRRTFKAAHDKAKKPLTNIRFTDEGDDEKMRADWSRWGHFQLLPDTVGQEKTELVHFLSGD